MPPEPHGSFAAYLAALDKDALTELIRRRPDATIEPVPRGFGQLAARLGVADSLGFALETADRDMVSVGAAVAALGTEATIGGVARALAASEDAVRDVLARLYRCGMAWPDGSRVCLPERLALHLSGDIGGGRPIATMAQSAQVEDLRTALEARGADPEGLRKPELIRQLTDLLQDTPSVSDTIANLPEPARERLAEHRRGGFYGYSTTPFGLREGLDRSLAALGLLLRVYNRWELPHEVAIAAWRAEQTPLTGRPGLPDAAVTPDDMRGGAQAAVDGLLQAMTTLLDAARTAPLTALKKGGVGTRERNRLATRQSIPADVLTVCIDVAFHAGLLGLVQGGYAPTEPYHAWRSETPARQWARLVACWFGLGHAPTRRMLPDGKEQPPPLPHGGVDGAARRALLRAARGGRSVRAAGERLDWFFPLHAEDPDPLAEKVAAAVRECEMFGLIAGDVLTELGEHVLATVDGTGPDVADELAAAVESLLPEAPCTVILQSDLTAVVSGRPSVAAAELLSAAAVTETRGTAAVWRFTPESVRHAFDAGWSADDLRTGLTRLSERPLPQPLEYLVDDVARRHGKVRVRGMRSCVLADEATITELLHTRSLRKLGFARLAPTVLSSPLPPGDVLPTLRAAGLSPMEEDDTGTVLIETRGEHDGAAAIRSSSRTRIGAAELAEKLLSDPAAEPDEDEIPELVGALSAMNRHLNDAEITMLADAIENQRDVLITYVSKTGSQTVRPIRPHAMYGRWLDSWCYLRQDQRDFTIANIRTVSPA